MASTVVVTGAAGALGSVLVRYLASQGARVAALDAPRAAPGLSALQAELGASCIAVPIDVASGEAWAGAIARIEKELGPPSGAVLVAGGWKGGSPFHAEADDSVYAGMMAVNADTAERSLRALLPGMVARRRGSVVVIGSRAVERPWTSVNAAAYAASKAAVVALIQAIAAEVLEQGVRLNAVLPSTIDTPANRSGMPAADPTKWVSPDSLARVIGFLLSDDSRDISGAAIPVYGRS
jgi:NAD(P)-dependent dehydrogenase (short-subunit alcohol dehydrogenase family)